MKRRKKIKIKKFIYKQEAKTYFQPKKCKWCNQTFEPINPNHQYCSNTCKDLAKEKNNRDRVRKYRKRYTKKSDWIGTGHLSEKPDANFDKEYQYIQKEMRRLHILKQ